jgi:hypothetical protein
MGRDVRIGWFHPGSEQTIAAGVRHRGGGNRLNKVTRTPRSSQKNFNAGNRPNLKSSLRVRREGPGAGEPVGLTGLMRIGYIAEVIGEETSIVGPLARGPTPEE